MNETKSVIDFEDEVIAAVKNGVQKRDDIINKILVQFEGYVNKFQKETDLDREVLYDIYVDTVLQVLDHIENDKFHRKSKLSTYLFRIYYFKVIDEIRKLSSENITYTDDLPDYPDPLLNAVNRLELSDTMLRVKRVLDTMSPECKEFIMNWGYLGYDLEELRKRMNFDNSIKFSKFKFNCIKKFRELWEVLPE